MNKLFYAVLICIVFLECSNPAGTTSENNPDNQYEIFLCGKILDEDKKPVANAVAILKNRKIVDTTGSDGVYRFSLPKMSTTKTASLNKSYAEPILDSIEFYYDNQIMASLPVSNLIDTLPDLFIIQRDIYGDLINADSSISYIQAVLSSDSDTAVKNVNLWYNVENGSYSGFVYFTNSTEVKNYSVTVQVFNSDSVKTGQSKTITFPTTAGNIAIPAFNSLNTYPFILAADTVTINIRDTVSIQAKAADSFGTVKKFMWALDGVHFKDTTDTSLIKTCFFVSGTHIVLVKAINNSNLVSANTGLCLVHVKLDPPVVKAMNDTIINIHDSLSITAFATDNGIVERLVWAKDGISFVDTTQNGGFVKVAFADSGTRLVIVKAVDDDGIESMPDTCIVKIKLSPPVVKVMNDTSINIKDTLLISASAIDNGLVERLVWAKDGVSFADTTQNGGFVKVAFADSGTRLVIVKAIDNDSIESKPDTCIIEVRLSPPIVKMMNDTSVNIRDTVPILAHASDNGSIVKFIWAKDGIDYSDTTLTGLLPISFLKGGRCVVRVKVVDNDGLVSLPDSCVISVVACSLKIDVNKLKIYDPKTKEVIGYEALGTVSINPDLLQYRYGDTISLTAIPKEHYRFDGFTGTLTSSDNPFTFTVTDNCSLFVTFIRQFTITATAHNGVIVKNPDKPYYLGTDTVKLSTKADSGFVFDYWVLDGYDTIDENIDLSFVIRDDFTIIANFTRSITKISTGLDHSMFILSDGSLWACGNNEFGQLGDGTLVNKAKPVKIMDDVKDVSAGRKDHTMIIKNDGTLWATGGNSYRGQDGQLGTSDSVDVKIPIQIMTGVSAVSAGFWFTIILKSDNSLWGTGNNYYGNFGNGTNNNFTLVPLEILTDVAAVSSSEHVMVIKTDGTLWAAGWNNNGQLGDGTLINKSTWVQVMADVADVCTGGTHTMILKKDGTLWATGNNDNGQLGIGNNISKSTPVQVMTGVSAVAAGNEHTMILKTDGTLWATGNNESAQLCISENYVVNSPIQVMTNVSSVSAGGNHTFVIKKDGSIWVAGENQYGQLGNGNLNTIFGPPRQIKIKP